MTEKSVKLYQIPPSPNNMKVRIGLKVKGIPFEPVPVDPADRSPVIELSRQPLTPVLVHGDAVVFDSGAILRYLEANFPGTPPLFAEDRETLREIESWETRSRQELGEPLGMVFRQFFSGKPDRAVGERASALLLDATAPVEERLSEAEWLVADRLTAADIVVACSLYYGFVPEEAAAKHEMPRFFRDHLRVGDERRRTRAWVERVMAYDR